MFSLLVKHIVREIHKHGHSYSRRSGGSAGAGGGPKASLLHMKTPVLLIAHS